MIRPDAKIDPVPARALNLALAREIDAGKAIRVMAAPAIGTGIGADLADFGLLLATERGCALDAGSIARTTWEMIENTRIRPIKDGKVFGDKSDALTFLAQSAERLLTGKLEIRKALGI
jgi:hypothetical protein